jgi:hypothetical protein
MSPVKVPNGAFGAARNDAAARPGWSVTPQLWVYAPTTAGFASCVLRRGRIRQRTDARRQAEPGEVRGEEGRDLGHPCVADGQDVEAAGKEVRAGLVPQVGAEGEFAVGGGGQR